jgi:hypothetical protein
VRSFLAPSLAVSLTACQVVTGSFDVGDAGSTSSSGGSSGAGTCGGATCAPSQRCDNGQCCPVAAGGGTCDVFPACGCSASENCARINGAAELCVPGGAVPDLGDCTDSTNCRVGLTCSDGVCDPPCDGVCVAANYDCLTQGIRTADGGVEWLGYSVCEPHCNPVSPHTGDATHALCGPRQRCDLNSTGNGDTYCDYPAGSGIQGMACTAHRDCAAGYDCIIPASGPPICAQYCSGVDAGVGTCPNATLTCLGFKTPLYDRAQQIGTCQ